MLEPKANVVAERRDETKGVSATIGDELPSWINDLGRVGHDLVHDRSEDTNDSRHILRKNGEEILDGDRRSLLLSSMHG